MTTMVEPVKFKGRHVQFTLLGKREVDLLLWRQYEANGCNVFCWRGQVGLRDDVIKGMVWQWQKNPQTCLDALLNHDINALESGQEHSPETQQKYRDALFNVYPNDFWEMLAKATHCGADFEDVALNLDWQYAHNYGSMEVARTRIAEGRNHAALYDVQMGQHHDVDIMGRYRACYAADMQRFFGMILAFFA